MDLYGFFQDKNLKKEAMCGKGLAVKYLDYLNAHESENGLWTLEDLDFGYERPENIDEESIESISIDEMLDKTNTTE